MRSNFTLILLSFLIINSLQAQFPDNTWLLGYGGGYEIQDSFGISILTFENNKLEIGEELEIPYELGETNAIISNSEGELQFYFNGRRIFNHQHELMMDGDNLYEGELSLGYDIPQGGMILHIPSESNEYLLMNTYVDWSDEHSTVMGGELFYSIIDMDENNNEGKVIVKTVLLEDNYPEAGKLTAVRHANGRDWWIIWPFFNSNQFMRFLLTPEGLIRLEDQIIGDPVISGLGQAHFTPDGNKLIFYNGVSLIDGYYVDIYDVDRCTGLLSNQIHFNLPTEGAATGCAISQNSRFLYVTSTIHIYQYDLWAEDIAASKDTVAVYDGAVDPFLPASFFMGQLARDGKIYISSPNSVMSLTVIEYPDRAGDSCFVNQHAVRLPVRNAFGIPTFPNHRLGPIDGSPCDTLGINNMPLANFRSDQDTLDYLSFYFQDLSAYEPDTWEWDFGDNTMSQDTSPVHVYQQDGVYPVCLTVSNENGSHTIYDTLVLGIIDNTDTPEVEIELSLFPNPVQDQLTIVLNEYYPRHAEVVFYSAAGQEIFRQRLFHGWNNVERIDWPAGAYFYEVIDQEVKLAQGKVVKI